MRMMVLLAVGFLAVGILVPNIGTHDIDEPAEFTRAVHFVLAPSQPEARAVPVSDARRIAEMASRLGFDTLIVQIANAVEFESVPELTRTGAWSKQQFQEFIEYADSMDLNVVPELKLLTHQEKFFQSHFPELMYNRVTYDPENEAVYDLVLPMLDEIIELMRPTAVSIGHDEVVGWNRRHAERNLNPGESMLPAELFLADVIRLHEHLESRGVETWMWGDMLLSPEEFPKMAKVDLHGTVPPYGKALRDQIPRNIVICDWHYTGAQEEFTSLSVFQDEGFDVLGAVWEETTTATNFSNYAAAAGARGMIATTWYYVPLRRWDRVEEILANSAAAIDEALDVD